MTLRYRSDRTLMPTVSAATGCSPIARVRSPHRVRNSPIWIPASSTYVMYRKIVESKKTGPMIGMSPSSGIFIGLNVVRVVQRVAVLARMIALYR